ncbi:MAG: chorismate-binding protein, partial [Desulforhopalus sp.]
SAARLYSELRRNQSVAYGAYIRNGDERTLSFSPELFFRKTGDEITVRPMKGTAARGRNSREEEQRCSALQNDIKNRSENVMIVDLLRNDLGRLMHGHGQGRVFVDSLFDVESYESLLQMTSTIKAKTAAATMNTLQLTDLFRSLFPCGSITGAPKIRTMEIIDELEIDRRGVYTGAIGYFGPDGSAIFSVPIRTVRLQGKAGEMGIGAGITHDSVPEDEWLESLLKGRFLTHAQPEFQLFETILWRPASGYWFLQEHLERLANGARFFKFSCDIDSLREGLHCEEKKFATSCHRVKLKLAKDGSFALQSQMCGQPHLTELPPVPGRQTQECLPEVDFSSYRVDTENPWRFHKTTMRRLYDEAYRQARVEGLFDYIFCNENGDVTEGCITNIIIYRQGKYVTPPGACGLLPGVMRRHLLEKGMVTVSEQVIREEDVRSAEAIYLCNSVRGLVRVALR